MLRRACFVPDRSWQIVSNQGGVQFLYNTPLLGFLAHEARQRFKLWKNSRGVVANAWNEEDNIIQGLAALPEFEIIDLFEKIWKVCGV